MDNSTRENVPSTKNRNASWGYGLELVGNVTRRSAFLLPEAYVKGKIRGLELLVGRRRETVGLADSTMGTGAYIWSGNALPMPKIQLSLAEYTPIGFTKGALSFRGSFAHGWFGNQGVVTHSYLHQLALYGRLGKSSWPVRFYGGFNHQVQWAGRSEVITGDDVIKNGRFPGGFKNYLNAVTGLSLAAKGDNIDTTEYSKNDRGNRVGNHLGTIDIAFEILARTYSLFFYRQSIYDDGSLYYLTNIADGLNGIRFRNNKAVSGKWSIQTAVLEFLYTKSQGGSTFGDRDKDRGADNYFNHGQYIDGWSYRGRTIGTPFIPPAVDTDPALPRYYTRNLSGFSNNNRVRVFHLGVSGFYRHVYAFQLKCSLSDNYGTYSQPFPERIRQFSALATGYFPLSWLEGMQGTVSLATDVGRLYRNSTGIYFGLRKNWR
ncbi:capsule assembly Wzi family protein [Larkinella rosea]|uniref:capsule assembly Wzi family protein n=1 Tax=Larkinella rosea TaxID=2025312 RepID=UPI001C8A8CD2|nr:capsule assembly Wzi family protein [Larkinella rosea]